jgi:hypothetical protein
VCSIERGKGRSQDTMPDCPLDRMTCGGRTERGCGLGLSSALLDRQGDSTPKLGAPTFILLKEGEGAPTASQFLHKNHKIYKHERHLKVSYNKESHKQKF